MLDERSERPEAGDERKAGGMSGALYGTSGDLLRGYCVVLPLILLATVVNALSAIYDFHRGGHDIPLWEPWLWEGSSAVAITIAALIVHGASLAAPPARTGWARLLLVNGLATLPFSAIHTGGMFGLRWLVYSAVGVPHVFAASDILYEYRKDLMAYAIIYGAFRITSRAAQPAALPAPRQQASMELLIEINDGARTHRVPLGAILSLRAAGNYVEFQLAGGDRPLMRTSLQDMQDRLAPHGFLRTHRSWIVNPGRVRQLKAVGSGDFLLTLENGDEAPLSRRFPEALARLRGTGNEQPALSAPEGSP